MSFKDLGVSLICFISYLIEISKLTYLYVNILRFI